VTTHSVELNQIIHADCIDVMRTMPSESIDLVLTDPPFLVNYTPRDQRQIANDRHSEWLSPAFAEMYRLLKPNTFCVSFYGWPNVERFMWAWKKSGFRPVTHFSFVKDYASTEGYTEGFHEVAYLLGKGRPDRPAKPIKDVLDFKYTGNPLHPNQKPVDLIQKLIETFSKRGDVVFDPFAGSGTTGIAARNCGRDFILIEKVWRYFNAAQHRLAESH